MPDLEIDPIEDPPQEKKIESEPQQTEPKESVKKKANLFSASSKPRGPKFGLEIDIAKIDELYSYGGEHAEMREDKAMEKLEQDI